MAERVLSLEMESLKMRKQLNEKESRIQELTGLIKLDVSFAESIGFCELENEENIDVDKDEDSNEDSFDSMEIVLEELELYNSTEV